MGGHVRGALLIPLALEENRGNEIQAMLCLALLLLGAGVNLIVDYIMLKKRGLRPLDAEITDIYTRQISRETKIWKGAKYTYYPVVRYVLDGKRISAGATSIPAAGIHFTRGAYDAVL